MLQTPGRQTLPCGTGVQASGSVSQSWKDIPALWSTGSKDKSPRREHPAGKSLVRCDKSSRKRQNPKGKQHDTHMLQEIRVLLAEVQETAGFGIKETLLQLKQWRRWFEKGK